MNTSGYVPPPSPLTMYEEKIGPVPPGLIRRGSMEGWMPQIRKDLAQALETDQPMDWATYNPVERASASTNSTPPSAGVLNFESK